jgi:hypothetical protein
MQSTLTQNSALYLAHNRTSTRRFPFFGRLIARTRIQLPDIHRRTFADAHVSRRFQPGNSR